MYGFTVPSDGGGGATDAGRAREGTVLCDAMAASLGWYIVPPGGGGCAIDP